ncbi:MAG: chemotaxis protein CheX [Candidatus Hydrogenedentes bacterium]|nr:chemotaxis protein CheX [Candidatus Hydrogenedentota bacterium]
MNTVSEEKLNAAVFDVFEKLVFMFGDVADKEEISQTLTEDYIHVSMNFTGQSARGMFALAVPAETSMEIAANVLGVEQDDQLAAAQATDALKEVLNVICGNLLTSVAGEKAVFNLTVPVVSSLDAEGWSSLLDKLDTHAFLVDDSPVLVQFTYEGLCQ